MGEHTPGPWARISTMVGPENTAIMVGQADRAEIGVNSLSDEYAVCILPLINDESEANERLIIAAPDMLQACEEIAALLVIGPHISAKDGMTKALDALDIARAKARAAIARATGETE